MSQDKLHDDDYADDEEEEEYDDVHDDTWALCLNEKSGLRMAVNIELGNIWKGDEMTGGRRK